MKRLPIIFTLSVVALLNANELDEQKKSKLREQIRYLCMIQDHYKKADAEKHTRQAMENMWKNVSQCFKDAKNVDDVLLCNELDKVRGLGSVLQQAQKNGDHQRIEKILEQVMYLGLLESERAEIHHETAYLKWEIYKNVKKCRKTDDKLACKQLKEMFEWADILCKEKLF